MSTVLARLGELRAWRAGAPGPVHLVPTMGALHDGHAALLRAARAAAGPGGSVVMSLFVNPLQFNDPGDLERYPRTQEADVAKADASGVDAVWAPLPEEMYPGGSPATTVHVAGVTEGLEGAHRPGHFDGVATVVSKLFHQTQPDVAWFGRKDAQQLAVIRRMTSDLDLPVAVAEHPTVREPSGLAMSSRNALLSPAERDDAARLSAGLFRAAALAQAGERDAATLVAACAEGLEYAALVDADSFVPLDSLSGRAVLAVAGYVGHVRLIDNVFLETSPGGDIRADLGVRLQPQEAPAP